MLTKADCLVLAALIEYTNSESGLAWPSKETLAVVTGLHVKTVQKSIKKIECYLGMRVRRGGRSSVSNRYELPISEFKPSVFRDRIVAAAKAAKLARLPDDSGTIEKTGVDHSESGVVRLQIEREMTPQTLSYNPSENKPTVSTGIASEPDSNHGLVSERASVIENQWREGDLDSVSAIHVLTDLGGCSRSQADRIQMSRIVERIEAKESSSPFEELRPKST